MSEESDGNDLASCLGFREVVMRQVMVVVTEVNPSKEPLPPPQKHYIHSKALGVGS